MANGVRRIILGSLATAQASAHSPRMARSYRNVQLRLPETVKARLANEGHAEDASLNAVIERRIAGALERLPVDPGPALWRRMDPSDPGSTFAFRPHVFERIVEVAQSCKTNLGDAAYNLLLNSMESNRVAAA